MFKLVSSLCMCVRKRNNDIILLKDERTWIIHNDCVSVHARLSDILTSVSFKFRMHEKKHSLHSVAAPTLT